ncbi:MAG: ATP-binding protein [Clostridia bacterium]|nr:ATP-binding protein [Clostridia bacterium]
MKKKKYYEVFLTTDNVSEESWGKFLLYISKLNGLFKTWKIYIKFEKNNVRYFIKTKNEIPTTLSDLNDFLIKKTEEIKIPKTIFKTIYIITNKEKNIIDVYDRNESKKNRKLFFSEVKIYPFCRKNYFTFTTLIFKNKKGRFISKLVLLNIVHQFLSIDFSKHTRFLFRKDIRKYLNIEKNLKLFECDNKNGILKIKAFPYLQEDYYLNLNNYDFDKHSLVIGGSGTGKSKFLSLLVDKIYKNPVYRMKYKIVIIDPHSSLEKDIGGLENTAIIDFKNFENSIDLFSSSKDNVVVETEIFLNLFKSLMNQDFNSKLERVLRHSIFLLIQLEKNNLKNLRELITDNEFRNNLIRKNKEFISEQIIDFFLKDFNELKNKYHNEAISPIISFIDELSILPVFSEFSNKTNLEELISKNFLSIFSLDETVIGEKTTKTISGLVMGQMFTLMQKRKFEEHIIFIIDEVSVVQNPILKRFLAESRKYNLSIILSGQYLNQVNDDIQKAIFSNMVNYYTFRISREDAVILSRNLQMEIAIHDSHFAKVKILTELANRECIVRVSSQGSVFPAFKASTLEVVPKPKNEVFIKSEIIKNKESVKSYKKFIIGEAANLLEIMKSQSTGRRKIVDEK